MEILAVKTGPVEKLHQPIDPITGPMCPLMVIATTELRALITQIQGMVLHWRVRERSRSPLAKPAQALGKGSLGGRTVRLPDSLPYLIEGLGQGFGCAITDLQKRVQETEDYRDRWKQRLPLGWQTSHRC